MARSQTTPVGQGGPAPSGPELVHLELIDEGAIAVITLDDPKRGNVMSPDMGDAFAAVVKRLKEHDELRAAIIRGAGKTFSIGGSRDMLSHLADPSLSHEARHTFMLGFYERWLSLLDIPVPVIAAIEGDCIGVAPIFACVSDICVADEAANFHITFAGLGLFPGMAMSYLVPKMVGAQQAAVFMVAGAPFSGRQAAECGFVARSAPQGTVHEQALQLARQIAANVPETVRALIQALRIKRSDLQPVLESDAARQAGSYGTEAYRQRIAKYLPNWYDTKEAHA
jgi:enoyl-CoA hydratase